MVYDDVGWIQLSHITSRIQWLHFCICMRLGYSKLSERVLSILELLNDRKFRGISNTFNEIPSVFSAYDYAVAFRLFIVFWIRFLILFIFVSAKRVELSCTVIERFLNPLNTELNPICHLLALAGAHHFVHVSRLRLNIKIKKRHVRK